MLFTIALIYTWFNSILPKIKFIDNYVTVLHNRAYFDTLIIETKKAKRSIILEYTDSLNSAFKKIKATKNTKHQYQIAKRYSPYDSLVNTLKISTVQLNSLKLALSKAKRLKGKIKDHYLDTAVRAHYSKENVLIVVSQRKKAESEKQRRSLIRSSIAFNIPGLSTIKLGFRIGLIFWMTLNIILLVYVYSTRLKMIGYLKRIYAAKKAQVSLKESEWGKLDLQVPLFIVPVFFEADNEIEVLRKMLGWKFVTVRNILGFFILLLIVGLQFHVGWMVFHVSVLYGFISLKYKLLCVVLCFITITICIIWLKPLRLSAELANDQSLSYGRRETLKLAAAALFFLILIPPVSNAIPLLSGSQLRYKRAKKKKKVKYRVNIVDGLYIHKTKSGPVLYHFYKGSSPSMKSIDEKKMNVIVKKIRKVDIDELINLSRGLSRIPPFSIPHWSYILEKEAYIQIIKHNYLSAIKTLVFSLAYSMRFDIHTNYVYSNSSFKNKSISAPFLSESFMPSKHHQKEIEETQTRIKHVLIGLIIRAEHLLDEKEVKEIHFFLKQNTKIPKDIFGLRVISHYRKNKSFSNKWKIQDILPWYFDSYLKT